MRANELSRANKLAVENMLTRKTIQYGVQKDKLEIFRSLEEVSSPSRTEVKYFFLPIDGRSDEELLNITRAMATLDFLQVGFSDVKEAPKKKNVKKDVKLAEAKAIPPVITEPVEEVAEVPPKIPEVKEEVLEVPVDEGYVKYDRLLKDHIITEPVEEVEEVLEVPVDEGYVKYDRLLKDHKKVLGNILNRRVSDWRDKPELSERAKEMSREFNDKVDLFDKAGAVLASFEDSVINYMDNGSTKA